MEIAMDRITELTNSVDDLSREARELRGEIRNRTRQMWIAIGVLVLLFVGVVFAVLDNSHQIDANNKKFCPLVSILIPKPGEPSATTPRGEIMVDSARKVFKEFHCE
jgi:hypothetical protein